MSKYTHILWDFNGTIVDDLDASIRCANRMLKKRGLKIIENADEYRGSFTFPVINYYKALGFDLIGESFDDISREYKKFYLEEVASAGLTDGIKETLEKINGQIRQVILTATERSMLISQLEKFGITEYFDALLAQDNILGMGKLDVAQAWVLKEKPLRAVVIGDTTHDYEVAQNLGADCILFRGGHQTPKVLEECNCPKVDRVSDIIGLVL